MASRDRLSVEGSQEQPEGTLSVFWSDYHDPYFTVRFEEIYAIGIDEAATRVVDVVNQKCPVGYELSVSDVTEALTSEWEHIRRCALMLTEREEQGEH